MADQDFDQTLISVRERPLSNDVQQQSSAGYRTMRDVLAALAGYRDGTIASDAQVSSALQGFQSDGFKVDPGSGLKVQLRAGLGYQDGTGDQPTNINGCLNADDLSPTKPLLLTTTESITVPTADATNPRIDSVFAKYSRQLNNPQSRGVLNLTTGVFDPTVVDKTLSFNLTGLSTVNSTGPINYVTGTPAGSPAAPATPAGYMRIADVYVPALAASITPANIADRRRLVMPGGVCLVTARFTIDIGTFLFAAPGGSGSKVNVSAPPGVDVVLDIVDAAGNIFIDAYVAGPFPLAAAANQWAAFDMVASMRSSAGGGYNFNPVVCAKQGNPSPLWATQAAISIAGVADSWPPSSPVVGGTAKHNYFRMRWAIGQYVSGAYQNPAVISAGDVLDFTMYAAIPLGG